MFKLFIYLCSHSEITNITYLTMIQNMIQKLNMYYRIITSYNVNIFTQNRILNRYLTVEKVAKLKLKFV